MRKRKQSTKHTHKRLASPVALLPAKGLTLVGSDAAADDNDYDGDGDGDGDDEEECVFVGLASTNSGFRTNECVNVREYSAISVDRHIVHGQGSEAGSD